MFVIPVYNVLALPDASLYLKTDLCKRMTGKLPQVDEKVVLLLLRENKSREDLDENSFYPVGVMGVIFNPNVDMFSSMMTLNDEIIQYGTGYYCR